MFDFEYSVFQVSGPNLYQIGNRTWYIPKVNKFYLEKGYPLLAEMKLKFEGLESKLKKVAYFLYFLLTTAKH